MRNGKYLYFGAQDYQECSNKPKFDNYGFCSKDKNLTYFDGGKYWQILFKIKNSGLLPLIFTGPLYLQLELSKKRGNDIITNKDDSM